MRPTSLNLMIFSKASRQIDALVASLKAAQALAETRRDRGRWVARWRRLIASGYMKRKLVESNTRAS